MKILIGDKGNIDFDSPVKMSDEQQKRFIEFLHSMFKVVKVEKTDEFRTERIGDKFFMKEWTSEEYATLLEIENTDKVAEMLGRTWMSVDIKRGGFIPDFLAWTSQKGKDPLKDDIKSLIKEFMKEKEHEILFRREKRKDIKRKQKEIERLQDELDNLDSDKKRSQIDLAIRLKQLEGTTVDKFIESKKQEITLKIEQLKKELDQGSPNS
tara:strand:+ start:2717 stop:3346 length:630 start_codon:yes stop_codon:yes gene_type:complete